MKKRSFSLALTLAICLSLNLNVSASEPDENQLLVESISMVLQGMSSEPFVYGLQDVDFQEISLGTQMPVYKITNGIIDAVDAIEYYPLFFNGDVVAIATIAYSEGDVPIAHISKSFASELISNILHEAIALIFADEGLYVWNGNSLTELIPTSTESSLEDLLSMENTSELDALPRTTISPETNLSLTSSTSTYATQRYLSVPKVTQYTTYSCWAACTKSIAGYYGITKSIDQIYDIAQVTKYDGASIITVWDVLEGSPFYLTCESELAGVSCLPFETLQYYIDCGYPLYGSVTYVEGSSGVTPGHALVIRGYYNYTNTTSYAGSISYMNPATGQYEASNVLASGNRPYIFTDQMGVELANIVDFLVVMD